MEFKVMEGQDEGWDFPGSPVVKTTVPLQGERIGSLVRELTFHMPHSTAKKKKEKDEG